MKPLQRLRKNNVLPTAGEKVKIKKKIMSKEDCTSFFVKDKHLDCRRPNEVGTYRGWVPGAGGDVWWIIHEDGTVGAYQYTELTDVK
jgi:hypothetical protein